MLIVFTIAPNIYDCSHHSDYKSTQMYGYYIAIFLFSCVTNLPWVSLVFRLIIVSTVLSEQIPVCRNTVTKTVG